ncbi:hypothetical protein U1Q18_016324 [Sarracenia purpurea var. burkii]
MGCCVVVLLVVESWLGVALALHCRVGRGSVVQGGVRYQSSRVGDGLQAPAVVMGCCVVVLLVVESWQGVASALHCRVGRGSVVQGGVRYQSSRVVSSSCGEG